MWAARVTIFQLDSLNCYQGRTQVGVGVKKALSLIFYKNFITCAKEIIVFTYFCLLICRLNANTMEWICKQISSNIINGPKSNSNGFWWESGLSSASRNHLTTFCRPFVHQPCLRFCSPIVHFVRNSCLYFVCYGWAAQVLTGLPVWLFWRQISQIWLFLEAVGVNKNCLAFWLFLFNIWLFWRQLAHTIRLVFWLFKCLAEKCY